MIGLDIEIWAKHNNRQNNFFPTNSCHGTCQCCKTIVFVNNSSVYVNDIFDNYPNDPCQPE